MTESSVSRGFDLDPKRFSQNPTLKYVVDSLGGLHNPQTSANFIQSPELPGTTIGYAPFDLAPEGTAFFNGLVGTESTDPRAYFITLEGEPITHQVLQKSGGVLPTGILFYDRAAQKSHIFDITGAQVPEKYARILRGDVLTAAGVISEKIFTDVDDLRIGHIPLSVELNGGRYPDLTRKLNARYGFDGTFAMFGIGSRDIYAPRESHSDDFQENLCHASQRFEGADVREIGTGTGINLLYALKFGARSIEATDISAVYTLLSRWNVRYVQDTGQVSTDSEVKILQADGFGAMTPGNLYVFNTPAIYGSEGLRTVPRDVSRLRKTATVIPEEDFLRLFKELKDRLTAPETAAIWRVHIHPSCRLVSDSIGGYGRGDLIRRAKTFLAEQGMTADYIPRLDKYSAYNPMDIFLLTA